MYGVAQVIVRLTLPRLERGGCVFQHDRPAGGGLNSRRSFPMIAPQEPVCCKKSFPVWHEGFIAMLPVIQQHACVAFRHLDKEAEEEAIAETIAHALVAYVRLFEQGKVDIAYPTVLALYGAKRVKVGRKVGMKLNVRDVASEYCQLSKGISIKRLDRYGHDEGWREILVEDRNAGPAEMAASRIDVADWFRSLPPQDRQIASALAVGNSPGEVARQFRVHPSLISHKRWDYLRSWKRFQGEEVPVRPLRCQSNSLPS